MLKRNPVGWLFIALSLLGLLAVVFRQGAREVHRPQHELVDAIKNPPGKESIKSGERGAEAFSKDRRLASENAESISNECQVELAAIDRYSRRPINACKFELVEVETLVRRAAMSDSSGISIVEGLKPGRYGVEAAREGYLIAGSSCPGAFIDVPQTMRVEFLFQEPYVCAFKIEGPQPYTIRFSESKAGTLLYSKSKQSAHLETELAKRHDAYVQVHLLNEPASGEPEHIVTLFYPHGVLTRRLRFVPLGLFPGPEVINVGASIVEPPASASIAFTCRDSRGQAVDLGPIGVRRNETFRGFLMASIESNAEGIVPAGDYILRLNHTIAPWIVAQELQAIGVRQSVHLSGGQRLELRVLLDSMTPVMVTFPAIETRQAILTLEAQFEGMRVRGAGIAVEQGQVVQVPPGVDKASLYSGEHLVGTLASSDWVGTGKMVFGDTGK